MSVSTESASYRGLTGLDEESPTKAWCQRWEELKARAASAFSRQLYEDAASTFTELVYRFQVAEGSGGSGAEELARALVESALFVTSFLTLTSYGGTRMNPMLGLHLFTLADICKGLRSSGVCRDAPDPHPFYEWARSILVVTHGEKSPYTSILAENLGSKVVEKEKEEQEQKQVPWENEQVEQEPEIRPEPEPEPQIEEEKDEPKKTHAKSVSVAELQADCSVENNEESALPSLIVPVVLCATLTAFIFIRINRK